MGFFSWLFGCNCEDEDHSGRSNSDHDDRRNSIYESRDSPAGSRYAMDGSKIEDPDQKKSKWHGWGKGGGKM